MKIPSSETGFIFMNQMNNWKINQEDYLKIKPDGSYINHVTFNNSFITLFLHSRITFENISKAEVS
jgi:hypothetical protein